MIAEHQYNRDRENHQLYNFCNKSVKSPTNLVTPTDFRSSQRNTLWLKSDLGWVKIKFWPNCVIILGAAVLK